MKRQPIECSKIEVQGTDKKLRSFSRDFAANLAHSIKAEGLYNPVVVRKHPEKPDRYILVQGRHRHYAVAKVLKEQFIDCTILGDDFDATDHEMAQVAENVFRLQLKKAQHTLCVQRWWEHYAAKNPGPQSITEGGKPVKKTKKMAAEGTEEEAETGTAPGTEKAFIDHVTQATGQSSRTAERVLKLAKAFDEDQLLVFDQMNVPQSDMEAIARVVDKAKRDEVVALISSGVGVKEALAQVMGVDAPASDCVKAAARQKAVAQPLPPEAEETDEEWLKGCEEKAAMLGDPARYNAAALYYHKINAARRRFRAEVKEATAEVKKSGVLSPLYYLVNRLINLSHPKDWTLCSGCNAQGVDAEGKSCKRCAGTAVELKTEVYI